VWIKVCSLSPVNKLNCLQSLPAAGGADCSELMGANIYFYVADVYLVVQLG
jgi:hypothetical protein